MRSVLVASLLLCVTGEFRRRRDVATTQGVVRGYRVEHPHPHPPHYQYLGVPYAGPPTGSHRFKAPRRPPRWDGIFEATHRVQCPQPDGEGQESCLVLNIFAPDQPTPMPVMVHFHDGGFFRGWGSFEAPPRLIRQGILVVTLNYRLGAAGFLCLGVEEAPGNAGLKDQVSALYWIHKNIDKFGGDPHDVTLYGTGSGAASIQFLFLSPVPKGLYHKAILESGSAISPASLTYNDHFLIGKEVASVLGLASENADVDEMVEFYEKASVAQLTNFSQDFRPCIDGEDSDDDSNLYNSMIYKDPMDILKEGEVEDVPLMFVYSDKEVLSMIDEIPPEWYERPDSHINELLPNNLQIDDDNKHNQILKSIMTIYFPNEGIPDEYVKQYVDLYSDSYVAYPVAKSALLHASRGSKPVYLMKFMYQGELSNYKAGSIPGASHGDIKNYIFAKENLSVQEEHVVEKLINLWSNFIKLGDPTPLISTLVPVIWQPIASHNSASKKAFSSMQYLELGADSKIQKKTTNIYLQFWDNLYTFFYKSHPSIFENEGY